MKDAERVSVAVARAKFSELISAVQFRDKQIVVQRNGRDAAVLISLKLAEQLTEPSDRKQKN